MVGNIIELQLGLRPEPVDEACTIVATFTTSEDGVTQASYQMYSVTSASTSWFVMGAILIAIIVIVFLEYASCGRSEKATAFSSSLFEKIVILSVLMHVIESSVAEWLPMSSAGLACHARCKQWVH